MFFLVKLPFKDFFIHLYIEMKTNALFSNKSFPAISSAFKRTVPALEKKHTTEREEVVETLQAGLRQRKTYYSKVFNNSPRNNTREEEA